MESVVFRLLVSINFPRKFPNYLENLIQIRNWLFKKKKSVEFQQPISSNYWTVAKLLFQMIHLNI